VPSPELSSNPLPVSPWAFLSRYWLVILILLTIPVAAAIWYGNAFIDRGYAPVQYVAFSHQQHVGKAKIDCQFCHFNAEKGKHAGIPPMSTCLGCHKNGGIMNDRPEVQKLLAVAEQGSYEQDGITYDGGVIHWKRVHKLPDHVYFSHQPHVAAGVACETCHGPVKEMAVMRQHADLTMGWCLECHRRSNYVTDPAKGDDAHRVGTASYPMQVGRQEPDPVVVFARKQVQGAGAHAAGAHGEHVAEATATVAPKPHEQYRARLAQLMAAYPDLPRWRVADLPSSHRAYLETVAGKPAGSIRADELLGTYMNAPTQCSTCHQ
jgi:hypothetical protein